MVWSNPQIFSGRIRRVCPFMDLFHVYKKMLENTWGSPELFYPFLAPFMHHFYPKSKVFKKPNLKQIEIALTCCRLVYPDIRPILLISLDVVTNPIIRTHYRNLIFLFEFLIPTVYILISNFVR